jgi:hypothetical protein
MCGDLKWTSVRGECLHKQLWLGRRRDQVNADKEEIPILPPCTSIGIEYSFNSNWDAHMSRKCLKQRNSWLSVSFTEFHCRWFRTEISLNICQFHPIPWKMIWNWNIGVYPVLEKYSWIVKAINLPWSLSILWCWKTLHWVVVNLSTCWSLVSPFGWRANLKLRW